MDWTGSERQRHDDRGCAASAAGEYVVPAGIEAEIKSDKLNAKWRPYVTTKANRFTRVVLDGKQRLIFTKQGYLLRVNRDLVLDRGQINMAVK